jgi:hypothetical protein
MSWFKRKTAPAAEQESDPVTESPSGVQLAVDSLNSIGRFASVIEAREVDGGFEVTGIPTDDRRRWVDAVGFIEIVTNSEVTRESSRGGLIFVRG